MLSVILYPHSMQTLFLPLLYLLPLIAPSLSAPTPKIGNPINPNLQTGQVDLFSSTLPPSTISYFAITYATPMSTPLVTGAVGVVGLEAVIDVPQGFRLWVVGVNETEMVVQAQSRYAAGGPSQMLSWVKVRFMVSSHPYLDISYQEKTFATTDNVYDPTKYDQQCEWIRCRQSTFSAVYSSPKATALSIQGSTFISGYEIIDIPLDSQLVIPTDTNHGTNWTFVNYTTQDYYGMSISPGSYNSPSCTITVTVFGFTQLRYVGLYLMVWESTVANTNYTRVVAGVGSVGCYYDQGGCRYFWKVKVNSNTTFDTARTYINSFYDNMYFFGISRFIVHHDYSDMDFLVTPYVPPPIKLKFTTTTSGLTGDQYRTNFQYTGNSLNYFSLQFSYLIDLNFDCPSTGQIYHVSSTACDSTCGNNLYPNNTDRLCWRCHQTCLTCIGPSPTDCLTCHNGQNRVRNTSTGACVCRPLMFYDDGASFTCPACSVTCLTCTSFSNADCTSCNLTDFRVDDGGGSCPCIVGYYHAGSATCVKCHFTCLTCTGGTGDGNCVTCPSVLISFRNMTLANRCDCIVGYFSLTAYVTCFPCAYTCRTCSSNASNCQSCESTNFRTLGNNTCPCNDGYYDDNTPLCKPCFSTCLTCNGPTRDDCWSCRLSPDNRGFFPLLNQCLCRTGFYDFSDICYPCHYSCLNCTNSGSNTCIACNLGTNFRTLSAATNQCLCNAGYFDLAPNPACQPCHATCQTCNFNATYCLSCRAVQNRILTAFTCPCKYGYVDVAGVCALCHYACQSCTGITNTTCLDCNLTTRQKSGTSCPCKFGLYDDGSDGDCKPCHIQCVTCVAGTNNSCLTCDSAMMRQIPASTPNFCNCLPHYYDTGPAACAVCHAQCQTCISTSTYCVTCYTATQFRQLNATTHVCQCQLGYYDTGADACLTCASQCSQCLGLSTTCTACPSLRLLVNSTCLCIDGYYQDTVTKNCLVCNGLCQRCTNTATQCTRCHTHMQRQLQGTSCVCKFGFYNDTANPICQPCPYYCNNCSALLTCRECSLGSHRVLDTGICKCSPGYYDDGVSLVCLACSPVCQQCSDYAVCTACNPALQRALTLGQCRCAPKFYDTYTPATPTLACQPCHHSCATCSSLPLCLSCQPNRDFQPGNSSCPCLAGYYQSGTICYLCSSNCRTCLGLPTNCTSCYSGLPLVNNTCLCFSGQFQSASVCHPCDTKCKQCMGVGSYCTECVPGHGSALMGNDCVCGTGRYRDAGTMVCEVCHVTCRECVGPAGNQCTGCDGSGVVNRVINGGNQCVCRLGYYLEIGNNTCGQCHTACTACIGPSNYNCSGCQPGYVLIASYCKYIVTCPNYLYQDTCVNVCPKTAYPTASRTCQKCTNGCLYCLTALQCIECMPGYFYNTTSYACSAVCPVGYYINAQRQCVPCLNNCLQCQWNPAKNLSICLKCTPGLYLKDQTQCTSVCSAPYYWPLGSLCLPCIGNCQTCNSLSTTDCLTCAPDASFLNGQCYPVCPLGYFQNRTSPSQSICHPCPDSCQACGQGQCLACKPQTLLSNSVCVPLGFFFNPQLSLTQPCHPNCLSCSNSSFASCIWCRPYRGTAAQMAVSGYCECWQGSIDMGNGVCDWDRYTELVGVTGTLVGYSSSVVYLLGLGAVAGGSYMGVVGVLAYLQVYSGFYFTNSSMVMSIDHVLQQYRKVSLNSLLHSPSPPSNPSPRLLLQLQTDKSLFLRTQPFQYLIQWGLVPAVLVLVIWALAALVSCVLCLCGRGSNRIGNSLEFSQYRSENDKGGQRGVDTQQEDILEVYDRELGIGDRNDGNRVSVVQQNHQSACINYTRKFFDLYFQSVPIVIHLIIGTQVVFYAVVSFKILHVQQPQTDMTLLSLSCLFFAYTVLYTVRLLVGAYRLTSRLNRLHPYDLRTMLRLRQSSTLRVLFHMHRANKHSPLNSIYLPLLLLRNQACMTLITLLSSTPSAQILAPCGVILLHSVYCLFFNPYPQPLRLALPLSNLLLVAQLVLLFFVIQTQYGSEYSLAVLDQPGGLYVAAWVLLAVNYGQMLVYMGLGLGLLWGVARGRCRGGKVGVQVEEEKDGGLEGEGEERKEGLSKKKRNKTEMRLNQESNQTINVQGNSQEIPYDYAEKFQQMSQNATPKPTLIRQQRTGYPLMINRRSQSKETESNLSKDDLQQVIVKRYRLKRKTKKETSQEKSPPLQVHKNQKYEPNQGQAQQDRIQRYN